MRARGIRIDTIKIQQRARQTVLDVVDAGEATKREYVSLVPVCLGHVTAPAGDLLALNLAAITHVRWVLVTCVHGRAKFHSADRHIQWHRPGVRGFWRA